MEVVRRLFIGVIAVAAAVMSIPAHAQAQTGTISGTVVDSASRKPLVGVSISVGDRRIRTGYDGTFSLSGVPAGDRVLRAVILGYRPVTRNITVATGATSRTDFDTRSARPRQSASSRRRCG